MRYHKKKYHLILLTPILFLLACEKKDVPYILPPPGNVEMSQVTMGENYDTQIYYRFKDKAIFTNHLFDWELQFETAPGAYLIRLNGGKQVQACNTYSHDFTKIFTTTNVEWRWDSPDGNVDSVAFRDWYNTGNSITNNYVYLIDRGPDVTADRYKKMQILDVSNEHYTFKFANLDGSMVSDFTLVKDTGNNYSFFTFLNGGQQVNIEPGKLNYDVLFTRYRYIYYDLDPHLPYTVNGVLINPYLTSVAADSITPFDSIDFEFTKTMTFSTKFDAIGFDWKSYNFTSSVYQVDNKKNYIIRNQEGIIYKLRFIDFYDSQGHKGSPKFEFQRL